MGTWACSLARSDSLRTWDRSHRLGFHAISLIVYNTSEDGRAISNKIVFLNRNRKYVLFIDLYSDFGNTAPEHGSLYTLSTRRPQDFFPRIKRS